MSNEFVTPDDAMALQGVPDGWDVVPVLSMWYAGRRIDLPRDDCPPLGPFETACLAVEAAIRCELEE